MLLRSVVVRDEDQSQIFTGLWVKIDFGCYLIEQLYYLLGLSVSNCRFSTDEMKPRD